MLPPSGGFTSWPAESDVSIAFTTYQAGRAFFIGRKQDDKVWAHELVDTGNTVVVIEIAGKAPSGCKTLRSGIPFLAGS